MNLAASTAAALRLRHLGLLRASGVEAVAFLHRLLSNDVARLAPEAAQWSSFNTAQGRMLANFLLWREGEDVCLALSADLAPALLKKLSFYILRAKVKLALDPERALIGLAGDAAQACLARAALPVPEAELRQAVADTRRVIRIGPGMFILVVAPDDEQTTLDALHQAGARTGEASDWQLAAIRAGLPCITTATQEAFVAQMLNFEIIGGVSFTKGCYPGQEIVARTQHLGKPKRRMVRIAFSSLPEGGIAPGQSLYAGSGEQAAAGVLVNVALLPEGGEALAVIRTEHMGGELRLGTPDGPSARIMSLPYEVPK